MTGENASNSSCGTQEKEIASTQPGLPGWGPRIDRECVKTQLHQNTE
jgi:hypothetical protein